MNASLILWPVVAQIALTLAMYVRMGTRKARAVKAGKVNRQETALDNRKWPEDVVKVNNNITNQFELPVLFYVLCLVFYSINAVGPAVLILAWVFVASRIPHALVHTGSNYVPVRMRLFLVGWAVVVVMTAMAAWQLVV